MSTLKKVKAICNKIQYQYWWKLQAIICAFCVKFRCETKHFRKCLKWKIWAMHLKNMTCNIQEAPKRNFDNIWNSFFNFIFQYFWDSRMNIEKPVARTIKISKDAYFISLICHSWTLFDSTCCRIITRATVRPQKHVFGPRNTFSFFFSSLPLDAIFSYLKLSWFCFDIFIISKPIKFAYYQR